MNAKKHARFRKVSAGELHKFGVEFGDYAQQVEHLAMAMDDKKLEEVDVDGGSQAKRAADLMFNFVLATDMAIKKAEREKKNGAKDSSEM